MRVTSSDRCSASPSVQHRYQARPAATGRPRRIGVHRCDSQKRIRHIGRSDEKLIKAPTEAALTRKRQRARRRFWRAYSAVARDRQMAGTPAACARAPHGHAAAAVAATRSRTIDHRRRLRARPVEDDGSSAVRPWACVFTKHAGTDAPSRHAGRTSAGTIADL